MSCGWLGCDRRQVSSPLYSVENNSSGEVIPSTLCEHEGGGRAFTASLFIYVALGGPFASGRVDRHSPPLFLLPISFPQYRSRTEQGPRPRGPVWLPSPHLLSLLSPVTVFPLWPPPRPSLPRPVPRSGPSPLRLCLPGRLFPGRLQGPHPGCRSLLRHQSRILL